MFRTHCRPIDAISASKYPQPQKQQVHYYFKMLMESDSMVRPPPPSQAIATIAHAVGSKLPGLPEEVADASKFRNAKTRFTVCAGLLRNKLSVSASNAAEMATAMAKALGIDVKLRRRRQRRQRR